MEPPPGPDPTSSGWERPARRRTGPVLVALAVVVGVGVLAAPPRQPEDTFRIDAEEPPGADEQDQTDRRSVDLPDESDDEGEQPDADAGEEPEGWWSHLRTSPLGARYGHTATATPGGLVVWGGAARDDRDPGMVASSPAGAVLAPNGAWRTVDPEDLDGAIFGHTATWTGEEVIVVGGDGTRDAGSPAVVAIDPFTATARAIDAPPAVAGRMGHVAAWTGSELVVWGGRTANDHGLALDPVSGAWRELPPGPLGRRAYAGAAWTGTDVVVVGGEAVTTAPGGPADPVEAAAYDPGTDSWRQVDDVPITTRVGASVTWTGAEVLVWGGLEAGVIDPDRSLLRSDGAAWDPGTGIWRTIRSAPLEGRLGHAAAWTGSELIVWGGLGAEANHDGAAWDPTTGAWRSLTPAPLHGLGFYAADFDGDRLLVWGASDRQAATGLALDPTRPAQSRNGSRLTY